MPFPTLRLTLNNCTCWSFGVGFGAALAQLLQQDLDFLFFGTQLSPTISFVKKSLSSKIWPRTQIPQPAVAPHNPHFSILAESEADDKSLEMRSDKSITVASMNPSFPLQSAHYHVVLQS